MKKYFESDDILALIWRWKKPLLIIFAASSLLSLIISSPLVIKPKFKSTLIAYPSNLGRYSEESPSEQMLQLLESDVIRDQLIKKFDLMSHYDIDNDDEHKINKLYEEYGDNFNFSKTKFESVELEVTDVSPEMAFKLINQVIDIYNKEVKKLQDAQTSESVKTLKQMLEQKEEQMDTLETRINYLREEYGILDYDKQVENLSKEYYRMLGRRSYDPEKLVTLEKELKRLKERGGEFQRLNQLLYSIRSEYTEIKIDYDRQRKELLRNKNYANVVVNPYISDKKVYPVRWLIVSVSVGITMIMALGLISFIDRVNRTIPK